MAQIINRPDPEAMQRLLDQYGYHATGTVLRLAWLEGLRREEIVALTWPDVSMEKKEIVLKDRTVPFYGDMESCIQERVRRHGKTSPYVVISEKFQEPLQPESVSRMVRKALDTEEMKKVRLIDLRHDFVIRRLETDDWATVARVSGLSVGMIQTAYSAYIQVRAQPRSISDGENEYRIWRILQEQKGTMVGLALALRWYMNVQLIEMMDMTWDDVDFEANTLHLPGRDVELNSSVKELLLMERKRRKDGDDSHVLLTENTRRPMDAPYLSRQIRTVLIRGGVEHIPFRNFQRNTEKSVEKLKIRSLAQKNRGRIARGDVIKELGINKVTAYSRLREMVDDGELVRVSHMYYLPGTVVPQAEQEQRVISYLRERKVATSYELRDLLGMERKQCGRFLRKMVNEGKLTREGDRIWLAGNK